MLKSELIGAAVLKHLRAIACLSVCRKLGLLGKSCIFCVTYEVRKNSHIYFVNDRGTYSRKYRILAYLVEGNYLGCPGF